MGSTENRVTVSGIGSDRGMPVRYKSIQRQEHDRADCRHDEPRALAGCVQAEKPADKARHQRTRNPKQHSDKNPCGAQESRRALSDFLFQPIIVMQSTEDRLGSDAVTDGKLMPMAAFRNILLDGFRCTRA
jgi:hypothetical protein